MKRLKFIDESGVNLAMTRLYGRAERGERAVGSIPKNYGSNVTRVATLGVKGLEAMITVDGATDGEIFLYYIKEVLCPTLKRGEIVIMDNLSAHKVKGVEEAIKGRGARVIYLPPYSPDLSPIERCWSKLKSYLRGVGARTREELDEAISEAIKTIRERDAWGWFAHCGYLAH